MKHCEVCHKKKPVRNVEVLGFDAHICAACVKTMKQNGHKVSDHGPVRIPQ